ncbi:MAG: lysylphosphatidylglycerol synthase transmembrane domain-containing protein [Candidatus Zixiibacteriota bacterium]
MRNGLKRHWRTLFGVVISLLFLYLAVRKVDFQAVGGAFREANYLYTIPNVVAILFCMWLRALRWRYLLKPVKSLTAGRLFSPVMIGFMANNLLPMRLGEFVRAYSLGEKEKISKSASFATIVVERVFDTFILLLMFAIVIAFSPFPDWAKKIGYSAFVINIAILLFFFFLKSKTEPTLRVLQRLLEIFPRKLAQFVYNTTCRFTEGLAVLSDLKSLFYIGAFSGLIWIIAALSNYFIFLSFDLRPPLYASFFLLVVVAFAIMLPASPGFIGTFHFGCTVALSYFKIDPNISFPFSVVLWSCQYFPVTLLGLYYLRKEHLSLKKVRTDDVHSS